jgi:hypothetical protein
MLLYFTSDLSDSPLRLLQALGHIDWPEIERNSCIEQGTSVSQDKGSSINGITYCYCLIFNECEVNGDDCLDDDDAHGYFFVYFLCNDIACTCVDGIIIGD